MKPAPVWIKVLEIALPISALWLCNWAMEQARDRGRQLPGLGRLEVGRRDPDAHGPKLGS